MSEERENFSVAGAPIKWFKSLFKNDDAEYGIRTGGDQLAPGDSPGSATKNPIGDYMFNMAICAPGWRLPLEVNSVTAGPVIVHPGQFEFSANRTKAKRLILLKVAPQQFRQKTGPVAQ